MASGDLPRLRNCRARLVWRYAGEAQWRDDFASLPEPSGRSFKGELRFEALLIELKAARLDDAAWELSAKATQVGDRPIELLRFHYLDGVMANEGTGALLQLGQQEGENKIVARLGEEAKPIRYAEYYKYWWMVPPAERRLPDPVYDQPNWVCAIDAGVLMRDPHQPGWLFGVTGPGKAFGEVGFRTAGAEAGHFYAGQLLDNILLAPGQTRELERLLMLAGDWQDGLRRWAKVCAEALGPARTKPPLAGFCSWYRNFADVTKEEIDKAIEQFSQMPIPPGGRMIQVDDGYQRKPGDWGPNDRFPKEWWDSLPKRIAASGSIPALWMAPLTVQDNHPIVKEHPEWFMRLPDGRFAATTMNWGWCDDPNWRFAEKGGHVSYNLDPDHPGARAFIGAFLKETAAAGWRGFKFDFSNQCDNARVPYDRSKTTFETLRGQWKLFREAVGPDALVNACGAPLRGIIGMADSARIGGDMVGNWTTMRQLLPGLLLRMLAWNGIWWAGDPDVFYMRKKNTIITGSYFGQVELTTSPEEQQLLLTAMGMMGGMMYTSDLPEDWSEDERQKVLEYWGTDRPLPAEKPRLAFQSGSDLPAACKVERNGRVQCALFNWSDEPVECSVSLAELGLTDAKMWRVERADESVVLKEGIISAIQPPHSARAAFLSAR
ncbi:MAG: hypothetical protein PHR35_02620 [Kiritimatiellae bacterium]|nr:hypothetical protein [Kiritimatiellia bacterium]